MSQPERLFTVAEANALLPQIVPLVEQLQGLHRSLLQTNERLVEVTEKLSQGNGYPLQSLTTQLQEFTQHQERLLDAFQSALAQLEALGGLLKDLQTGLVDFYTLRDGELIFLCWKLGEDHIRFWHSLETGYAERQAL